MGREKQMTAAWFWLASMAVCVGIILAVKYNERNSDNDYEDDDD